MIRSLLVSILLVGFAIGAHSQNYYYPPTVGNNWDTLSPSSQDWCQEPIDSLYAMLQLNNSKAFILLIDGKIVLEKYFDGHTYDSPWYWASAGKTLTAFLVGLAQQDGFLRITDTTSKYLGQGWTSCNSSQELGITIWNQLTMTSGLNDQLGDPYCTDDTCLQYLAPAGTRWAYHNGPYTLLDGVMEAATGTSLNLYAIQKLRTSTGITGSFIQSGYNNVYFSTPRSMARFGHLVLSKGAWNGVKILDDSNYFNQMVNTSQQLNKSYGYLWWLNGKSSIMLPGSQLVFNQSLLPNAPTDVVAALGRNGQIINVVPSRNMVWIRMGEMPGTVDVPFLLNDQIWQYINNLPCLTSHQASPESNSKTTLFPNPFENTFSIESTQTIERIEVYSIDGRFISSYIGNPKEEVYSLANHTKGVYFVKLFFEDGTISSQKLIKE